MKLSMQKCAANKVKNTGRHVFIQCFAFVIFASLLLAAATTSAQTLFTYNKKAVSKDEFLNAYYKNNSDSASKLSLAEYFELYMRFKLKVQAAIDAKLD